ncbi:LANO_0F16666g1_1 [Lachancea nothofagi CBS 11611]|uniref:LANO_0F16666g1_1 n=1 Tax=Lachancea nothofagi CBS 11611 TaxID=1266666 RepID=A0A1G4KCV4_9SACH|nr:LANO_0F16666g1_1 [Lachancea nothofagi CBS 11611]
MSQESQKARNEMSGMDKDELEQLRKVYGWKASYKTWRKSSDGRSNERELLSTLGFFPDGDATRKCAILDVGIENKQYIHEFEVENTQPTTRKHCKDMVIMHGYGAALGLFVRNFDGLSRVPGLKLHAIDMLGYGLSSRPPFPGTGMISSFIKRGNISAGEVHEAEDFFIDSLEQWRQKKQLERFVLVGHSLGGYLSCCYALKYPNRVEKLILVSPVGVETSVFDLTRKHSPTHAHAAELGPDVAKEVSANKKNPTTDNPVKTSSSFHVPDDAGNVERVPNLPRVFSFMWTCNISPFGFLRSLGPAGALVSSKWSFRRFSFIKDQEQLLTFHNYCYSIFAGAGSGEYALTRILAPGVLARLPLLSRAPGNLKCDSLWMYGSHDWMSKEAGTVIAREINKKTPGIKADFTVVSDAGHHLYLDNPPEFNRKLVDFLKLES